MPALQREKGLVRSRLKGSAGPAESVSHVLSGSRPWTDTVADTGPETGTGTDTVADPAAASVVVTFQGLSSQSHL